MKPPIPLCCKPVAFGLIAQQLPVIRSSEALLNCAVAIALQHDEKLDPSDIDTILTRYAQTVRNQKAALCSGGEKRKLEIARALVTKPKLILLDEPFSAVDPIAVEDLQREVKRLKEEFGKSVLITDHNVAQTLRVCDRALIIGDGKVKFEGTPREVINDSGVKSEYLGNTFRGDEFDSDKRR